jgi:hypothetical protein
MVVYRSIANPNGCSSTSTTSIDLGVDDIDKMGLGWYWSENFGGLTSRWMQNEASVYLVPPESFNTLIVTAATAFDTPRHVEIWINTEYVGAIDVVQGWQTYTLDATNIILESSSRIQLRLVTDIVETVGDRELAIAVSSITFE